MVSEVPAQLDYAPPETAQRWRTPLFYAALIVCLSLVVAATWVMTNLRCSLFGFEPACIFLAGPMTAVMLAGLPGVAAILLARRASARISIALLIFVPGLFAEAWASAEEMMILRRHGRTPAAEVVGTDAGHGR